MLKPRSHSLPLPCSDTLVLLLSGDPLDLINSRHHARLDVMLQSADLWSCTAAAHAAANLPAPSQAGSPSSEPHPSWYVAISCWPPRSTSSSHPHAMAVPACAWPTTTTPQPEKFKKVATPPATQCDPSPCSQATSEVAGTFILAAKEEPKRQRRRAGACGSAGGSRAATLCGGLEIGVREASGGR